MKEEWAREFEVSKEEIIEADGRYGLSAWW